MKDYNLIFPLPPSLPPSLPRRQLQRCDARTLSVLIHGWTRLYQGGGEGGVEEVLPRLLEGMTARMAMAG